jgi:Mg/Co/Ni transporter MgtE
MDLSNYLQNKKFTKGSQRNDILRQIYSFYDSDREVFLTKKKNWKRYIEFLKENKLKDTKENQDRFKKSKKFIKKMSSSTVAYFVSHIPTNDLYYVLSVVKDKSFRNESVGAYIMSLNYVKDRKF